MKKKFTNKRRTKKRNNAFCPDSAYIEAAVGEFLQLGGTIEILEYDVRAENYDIIVSEPGADSFLMGEL